MKKDKKKIVLIFMIVAALGIPMTTFGFKIVRGSENPGLKGDSNFNNGNGRTGEKAENNDSRDRGNKNDKCGHKKNLPTEPTFSENIMYDKYKIADNYVVVKNRGTRLYSRADYNSQRTGWANSGVKIPCEWTQTGWYKVSGEYSGRNYNGFIAAEHADFHRFRIDDMKARVRDLYKTDREGELFAVDNYNSRYGKAPLWNGKTVDALGNQRGGSVAMYVSKPEIEVDGDERVKVVDNTDFMYVSDGTLVKKLKRGKYFSKVCIVESSREGYIQNMYLDKYGEFDEISLVAVIDTANQNEAVFKREGNNWELISKTLCTTGKEGVYSVPTAPGVYGMVQKKPSLFYLKDGTDELEGYAPYALRFNGGAYIHGIPVNYIFPMIPDPLDPTKTVKNLSTRIDPGHREFSRSVGTIPLSHKCVRNYTSHAKFLYDIFEDNKGAVIVIN